MKTKDAQFIFAVAALVGLLAGPGRGYKGDPEEDEQLAEDAWRIAEVMVEDRAAQEVLEP